jgi:hypothetical protein
MPISEFEAEPDNLPGKLAEHLAVFVGELAARMPGVQEQWLALVREIRCLIGEVAVYGSVATALNIPESDLDLMSLQPYSYMEQLEQSRVLDQAPFVR